MQNRMNEKLKDLTFVAFDTETSGAYPVGFDVVEFGAAKWKDGKIIDQLQFYLNHEKSWVISLSVFME